MVQLRQRFEGPEYKTETDKLRLSKQIGRIYRCIQDGAWRTLEEIAAVTGDGESSVSAQLRNLRKPQFGSFVITRRPRGDRAHGLFEYRVEGARSDIQGQRELEGVNDIVQDLTGQFMSGLRV